MNLEKEQLRIDKLRSKIDFLERSIRSEKKQLIRWNKRVKRNVKAQQILQVVSQTIQQKAHHRISKVVSSCLQAVFGEEAYEFKIQFDRKRGKTEAKLLFVRDGLEVDPITSSGGGMIDVAAFALRVVCLVLHRPRLRPLIVADEPMKNVSEDYQDAVRTMMEKLSQDMGIQIVMVTHNSNLATGKIIEI